MRTKVPKGHAKGKRWNRDRLITTTNRGFRRNGALDERHDGWSFDGENDDGNGVEWRENCEQTHVTSASSFSLENSEWEKMNLNTRVAVNIKLWSRRNWRWKFLRLDSR